MEAIDESGAGYPEEQPPGAQPGDAQGPSVPERAADDEAAERAPDNDDGTATGNEHTTSEVTVGPGPGIAHEPMPRREQSGL